MSIVRYDPFRDLRTLQEEVNRLFTGSIPRTFDEEGIARGAWSPSVDIYENKEQIEISRAYEKMPNPALLATTEFLDGKIYYRKNDNDLFG